MSLLILGPVEVPSFKSQPLPILTSDGSLKIQRWAFVIYDTDSLGCQVKTCGCDISIASGIHVWCTEYMRKRNDRKSTVQGTFELKN